jgi:hypothetical protein
MQCSCLTLRSFDLQGVNLIVPGPLSENLAVVPEQNTEGTPKCGEAHIQHNRRNIAIRDDLWRDELAKTVSPEILVDSDSDEDGACDGLV